MNGVVHIAGPNVTVGPLTRQRCAWCGALLLDYDLDRIAVPAGQDPAPGMWPVGALVWVDGHVAAIVDHAGGNVLPSEACARLDPAVTR